MARVFLSHSSRDNAAATELKAWLDDQGFAPAFLDFDKHSGIPPGADWERTLYAEIQRCQALLIVQTPNWSASRWCFAEFTQARALGKPIFQVVQTDEAAAEKPIAADLQRLDLRHDRPAGLEQLRRELERIALQRRALALGARLVGVNNRDLRSFVVDLAVTERLSKTLPSEVLLVTESGVFTAEDVARMARTGARAMLVGESLMRQPDVTAATRALLA
jgi:hypothetical protein